MSLRAQRFFFSTLSFALALPCAAVLAADANFYTLNQKWEKQASKPKSDDLDDSFTAALRYGPRTVSDSGLQRAAPPMSRTLAELAASGRLQELELGQSLIVAPRGALQKFIATSEGVVAFETGSSGQLRVIGQSIGATFVHVWDAEGRGTFQVQVKPQPVKLSPESVRQLQEYEHSRSFKVYYENARSAFYTADKPSELQRSTLDYDQRVSVEGDTPYGFLTGHIQTQSEKAKQVITDTQVKLEDGRVGPFRGFDAALGDSRISTEFIAFPGSRIRGVDLSHEDEAERVKWRGFFGREQESVVGTLTPGVFSRKTRTAFLGGGNIDYRLNDDARIKAGYFNGYGRSRPDELNRHALALKPEIKLGPHVLFIPEADFDNEHLAQKHALQVGTQKMRLRTEYRDINEKFTALAGAPSRQGELGYIVDLTANPHERLYGSMLLDIFRDRLIPNPENTNYWNFHKDFSLTYTPWDRTSLTGGYQDYDDTGRIGPSKQRTISLQLNQGFDWFGRRAAFFSRYQNRGNRNLTNPLADYVANQAVVGFNTPILWDIQFSMQQEWTLLEETNLRSVTHPSATTYSLDRSFRIGDTPFYGDLRARWRDEEETESGSSFMAGEDLAEIAGGLYYRETQDLELFLTGSLQHYSPESLNLSTRRVEGQFLAGMKGIFDTGYHWDAVGTFSGYVFKDLNADGIRQPEEPGMPGMAVKLSDGRQAETDASGFYKLGPVSGKNAALALDASRFPQGYVPTGSVQQNLPITQGQEVRADFGLVPRSEVSGIIFSDLNEDGKFNVGDYPIKKARVRLEDGRATVTGAQGTFRFPELVAGDHTATLDLTSVPEGYLPQGKPSRTFTLFEGMRYELQFPLKAVRTLAGRVYRDVNGNGRLDQQDPALASVRVVYGDKSVETDAEGYFLLDKLPSGPGRLALDPSSLPAGVEAPSPRSVELSVEPIAIANMDFLLKDRSASNVSAEVVGERDRL